MTLTPIDRYFAAECVKREVDKVHKEAKAEAEAYLDEARENGQTALVSTFFGEDAGEYKRGKTRAKQVVEYNVCDIQELNAWLYDNLDAMSSFVCDKAIEFAQYWFEKTGELPEGTSRVYYDEPSKPKPPQIYRYDHDLVKATLADGGNLLVGANQLLLSGGDE